MKKFTFLAGLFILLSSCSTIKIVDSWKSDDVSVVKNEHIIVIARTDDQVARQRFEQEIANRLRSAGFNATESYKKFPAISVNKKETPEEVKKYIQILKNEGFEAVVLTVLRDKTKKIVTSETGSYVSGGYYPSYYGPYYGGFGRYYGSVYSPYGYGYGGTYVPVETRTYTSETYVLETVVYNLKKADGKQLVAVVTAEVIDPKSSSKLAPEYADKVLKSLK
ncbi:MAG: hypothetical protein DSY82_06415 [Flavobacteriia bacterium]|nr:MAG: hypothetical protein DSY82_06415 [Flavobacteriia bacterium]